MIAKFSEETSFHAAVAAAVRAGLRFEAYVWPEGSGHGCWLYEIEYTGGY